MVESINTKVDLVIDATAFTGLTDYGKIMIGDKGIEFFNARDARKYIQIPWEEVENVIASVMFKGKWTGTRSHPGKPHTDSQEFRSHCL